MSEAEQNIILQKLGFCAPSGDYLATSNGLNRPNLHQLRAKAKIVFARNFRTLLAEKGLVIDDADIEPMERGQNGCCRANPHFCAAVAFLQREPLLMQYKQRNLYEMVRSCLRGKRLPRTAFITHLSVALDCNETDLLPEDMLNMLK